MKGKRYTQTQQVIDTLRQQGRYATLGIIKIDDRISKPTDYQQLCQRSVG